MNINATVNRFLPNSKWQRRMATKGIDHEDLGLLPIVGLRKDESVIARLLPPVFYDINPEWNGQLLVEHRWGYYPNSVQTVCPVETHRPLLEFGNKKVTQCPACAAGVPAVAHIIVHAALEDKRQGVALKLSSRDFGKLLELIDEGCMSFKEGCRVELWREGWKLQYRALADDPINEEEFKLWLEPMDIHVRKFKVKLELLQMMADGYKGWMKAGQPQPQPNQYKALAELLPQAVLLELPWFFKAPQRFGWQDTTSWFMGQHDYHIGLNLGNIGIKCGLMTLADGSTVLIVGLDGDSDEFAAELELKNPWLKNTFCVTGNRGRKWFFMITGTPRVLEACSHSTKIKREVDGKVVDVGDWLAEGKQGVALGGHPAGKFYRHNGLPMVTLTAADFNDFTLPDGAHFARTLVKQPKFKGGGWMSRDDDKPAASVRTINSALSCIEPDERDTWFTVGAALKAWGLDAEKEDLAREIWDEWSAQSSKFDEGGQDKLWESLNRHGSGTITVGSLFFLAYNNGWKSDDNDDDD